MSMDQLAKDMIQCKADGYGCYYGRWPAAVKEPQMAESEQPHPKKAKAAGKAERPRCVICGTEIPEGSRRTKTCGPSCGDTLRLRQYQEAKERRRQIAETKEIKGG